MKKLLIIAVASSFIFISCSKEAPTPAAQPKTQSAAQTAAQGNPVNAAAVTPGPPAQVSAHQYVITNVETNWGVAPYVIGFRNANTGQFQTVTLNMGQSITVCLDDISFFTTNFAYSIKDIGNC